MLKRILRKHAVDEILIASDTMRNEILNRVKLFGEKFNITVRRNKIFFEELPVITVPAHPNRRVLFPSTNGEPSTAVPRTK